MQKKPSIWFAFTFSVILGLAVAACCGKEFTATGSRQGSMAGATPSSSEKSIACVGARAVADQNATCPRTGDKPEYTVSKRVSSGTCTYALDAANHVVTATVTNRYKCCEPSE